MFFFLYLKDLILHLASAVFVLSLNCYNSKTLEWVNKKNLVLG